MCQINRLITYYHDPGNKWRLVHAFWWFLSSIVSVFVTLRTTYWWTPSLMPEPITAPLDRLIDALPMLAVAGLWLLLAFYAYKRASFDVPWRIWILEDLPAILLAVAAFGIRIVYDMQIS